MEAGQVLLYEGSVPVTVGPATGGLAGVMLPQHRVGGH